MAAFPTLSRQPSYPLGEETEDMVIRDPSEAGYETTRPRFTKRRRIFTVVYGRLPKADVDLIDAFFAGSAAYGSAIFTWTHPKTAVAHNVRFTAPPKTILTKFNAYDVSFSLREA